MCEEKLGGEKTGGGVWIPVKVPYPNYSSLNIEYPRDGSYYAKDLRKMFPKRIITYYLNDQSRIMENPVI